MDETSERTRSRLGVRILALLLVALAAGAGAVVLRTTLDLATSLLLGGLVVLRPAGDGQWSVPAGPLSGHAVWAVPVLVAAGTGSATWLSRFATRRVNGTDGVIRAVNLRDTADLTVRGGAVKLAGTVVTLGAGGSGGTEGPVVQVSAGLAAAIARRLRMSEGESGLLVAAALGAGVAALFQAPLGGALLAGEVLRRRGIDWTALLFTLPAAFVAFAVFGVVCGYRPLLGVASLGPAWSWTGIALLAATGAVCGILARLYVWSFHRIGGLLAPLARWREATAVVGGAFVGCLGIGLPMVLGTGYGSIAAELSDGVAASLPLWVLLTLPFAKMVATAVTLHSGGVGGVFGPAMVIGATGGVLCWRLAESAGAQPGSVAVFAITGMAACLGTAVRAPLAALLLAVEATGNLLPSAGMLAGLAVATACAGDTTLFPSQAPFQLSRRSRQLDVSVVFKSATGVNRRWAGRMFDGVGSRIGNVRTREGEVA